MKLQQLEIHNIASIEDATIDFEGQPLADSEVFLITGKTGAGKSTILDAICLALYATTPRLDNTLMQGDTKDQEKEIKIKDPVQLMRRNTGEAHVVLTFTGSNGVRYEATWSVARARNKVTGKIQGKKWSLHNLDTDFTYTKDKEIKDEIATAIGLDFKQFCRTTLLAQGEFTRFLNSKDDDKAEILEKITGVDAYSKIGAKIFEKTAERRKAWEDAQQSIEGIEVMSDEMVESKNEEIKQLDEQERQLKGEIDKTNKTLNWLKDEEALSLRKTQVQEECLQARHIIESEEAKQAQLLVDQWNESFDARSWLKDIHTHTANISKQEKMLEQMANEFHRLHGGLGYEQHRQFTIAKLIKDNEDFLKEESNKLDIYKNVQTIVGYMHNLTRYREVIKSTQKDVAEHTKQLSEVLQPRLAHEQKVLTEKQQEQEAFIQKMKEVETEVEALHLPLIRQRVEQLRTLLNDMATAKTLIGVCNEEEKRQKQALANLSALQASIEEKQKLSEQMTQQAHDAEIEKNTLKGAYEKQRESVNKWAKSIRANLHIGDICPVCQQKVTSALPEEDAIDALVSQSAQLAKEAEAKYEKLMNSKNALDAEIKAQQTSLKKDTLAYEKGKENLTQATQKAKQAMIKVVQGCLAVSIVLRGGTNLEESEQQARLQLQGLTNKINAAEAKEKEQKTLQAKVESLRKACEQQKDLVLKAQKEHDDCKSYIDLNKKMLQSYISEAEKNEKLVNEYVTIPASYTNIMDYAVKLVEDADQYTSQKEEHQKLQALYDQYVVSNEHISTALSGILELMPAWEAYKYADVEKLGFMVINDLWVGNLQSEISKLHGQVSSALSQIKASKEAKLENQQLLDKFIKQHAEEGDIDLARLEELNGYSLEYVTEKSNALSRARQTLVSKETLLKEVNETYEKHLLKGKELLGEEFEKAIGGEFDKISDEEQSKRNQENELSVSLQEKLIGLEAAQKELSDKRGGIIRDLEIDRENKEKMGTLIAEADKKKAEYEKWSRLNQLLGDATGNKFRRIAQSYVLASLIHSANGYMRTLSDRYILKVVPGSFVITMEDAYQGYASRAASTLSGGESFLVSLSLALALSDIGNQLSVDTLFIDEGFGTLSGEPLQHAIDTLRSLHSKSGRHVGIISHVEELKERIPVQIRVNQEGNNSSSTIEIVG